MRSRKLLSSIVAIGWCFAPPAGAAVSADLADLAARIDYGFYNDDARTIEAARTALERLGDSADVVYYRDLAALRLAQLTPDARARAELVRNCVARGVPADSKGPRAAEGWLLVAACAEVGGASRRAEQALARARELDRDNPRIVLVEAWALQRELASDALASEVAAQKWQAAVAAFDTWSPPRDAPQWGHAEALVELGELALARGEVRMARDLVERALLLAPGYSVAVELRGRVQGSGAGARTP